jgi:Sugar-transfer associated ATP-grasp
MTLLRWLRREVIRRRLPHGLVHWRYLLPRPPPPLARQRSLWLTSVPGLPRPLWWTVELWLWLRWQLWHGPHSVWRAVRRLGPRVRDEEGISLLAQGYTVARLALAYCIPPHEIYRYRLYRRDQRGRVGMLVYDHTVASFHQARNDPGDATHEALRLLADKQRQTAELAALGVPVVPIHSVVPRRSSVPLRSYLGDGATIFCKPRHGSAGRGAFTARISEGGCLMVDPLVRPTLSGEAAEAYWTGLLKRDDMLIQPRLSVDQDFSKLATADDIVTVRYISQRVGTDANGHAQLDGYCATLELPCWKDEASGRRGYVVLEIDAPSGKVEGFPEAYLSGEAAARYRSVTAQVAGMTIPNWQQIRQASHIAHRRCRGIHAIAWDWALTAEGPLLLEGNSGWSTSTPQLLGRGLITAAPSARRTRGA